MVAELIAEIAKQGFAGLLSNLASDYIKRPKREIKHDAATIKSDFSDHLKVTFNKCTKVKTILNGDQASETLSIYVDQTFRINRQSKDQYSLIEHIRAGHSTVILGAGGGGKSMFMRYLWHSYFERADGHIPFFLELRHLNTLTHNSIEDFIYHSILKTGSKISQNDFSKALKAGEFILFLDGFDEINFDSRDRFQLLILELQESNPELTIVLTSRPDERFMGWENFTKATVEALDKDRSELLIERADYDPELKAKFLSKFDRLYKLHRDFLSNPLLAYMMLVSFSYNPDIPRRMFQFYEQAFEALYHRHDLTKNFKRKFHCSLDKFEFLRLTSYFCLKTYYDEQIEFSRNDILEAIEDAKSIEKHSVGADDFLSDLTMSVCLLKLEGLTYTFTHRSFQEYFAAYCISRVASRNIEAMFSKFSKRFEDSVLPMVADINPDLFREKYILPNAKKFKSLIDRKTESKLYESFSSRVGAVFTVHVYAHRKRRDGIEKRKRPPGIDDRIPVTLTLDGEMSDFYKAVRSVASDQDRLDRTDSEADDEQVLDLIRSEYIDVAERIYIFVADGKIRFSSSRDLSENIVNAEDEDFMRDEFKKTLMYSFILTNAKMFIEFVRQEREAYKRVSGAFSDLF